MGLVVYYIVASPTIFASIYKICKCESMSPRQTLAAVENVDFCVLFDGMREQCAENEKTEFQEVPKQHSYTSSCHHHGKIQRKQIFFLTLGFFFTLTELSLHKCIFFHLYLSNQNRCFKTYVDLCFFFLMGNTVFLITFPSERFCLIQRNKLFSENLIRLLNSSVCLWAMYLITHRYMQYVMWKQFSLDSIVAVTKVDFEIMSFHPRILRIAVYSLNWWYSSCIMQQCNLFM